MEKPGTNVYIDRPGGNKKPIRIPLRASGFILVILILLAGNILFGIKLYSVQNELTELKRIAETRQINERVLDFSKLFIAKVLKSETEASFEDRLSLESAVRNLNDEQILAQWQKFTGSKTEEEAQNEVKNLLELLVNKIKVQ